MLAIKVYFGTMPNQIWKRHQNQRAYFLSMHTQFAPIQCDQA